MEFLQLHILQIFLVLVSRVIIEYLQLLVMLLGQMMEKYLFTIKMAQLKYRHVQIVLSLVMEKMTGFMLLLQLRRPQMELKYIKME